MSQCKSCTKFRVKPKSFDQAFDLEACGEPEMIESAFNKFNKPDAPVCSFHAAEGVAEHKAFIRFRKTENCMNCNNRRLVESKAYCMGHKDVSFILHPYDMGNTCNLHSSGVMR